MPWYREGSISMCNSKLNINQHIIYNYSLHTIAQIYSTSMYKIVLHRATEIHQGKSCGIGHGTLIEKAPKGQDQWLPEHHFAFRAMKRCLHFLPRHCPCLQDHRKLLAKALTRGSGHQHYLLHVSPCCCLHLLLLIT